MGSPHLSDSVEEVSFEARGDFEPVLGFPRDLPGLIEKRPVNSAGTCFGILSNLAGLKRTSCSAMVIICWTVERRSGMALHRV